MHRSIKSCPRVKLELLRHLLHDIHAASLAGQLLHHRNEVLCQNSLRLFRRWRSAIGISEQVSMRAVRPTGDIQAPARHEKYDLNVIIPYILQRKFILAPAVLRFLCGPRSHDRHTPRTTKHDTLCAVALSQLVKKRHHRPGMTVAPYRKARLCRSAFIAYSAQCSVLRSVPGVLKARACRAHPYLPPQGTQALRSLLAGSCPPDASALASIAYPVPASSAIALKPAMKTVFRDRIRVFFRNGVSI